jgi:MoxR-like ATPase
MSEHPFELVSAVRDADQHDSESAGKRLTTHLPPRVLLDFRQSARHFRLDKKLEIAVNTALAVGAPLLLTGEPGTGKTQVAYYLSWYFAIPVFDYQVRSTSTADDMKYDFDAVGYLHSAKDSRGAKDEAGATPSATHPAKRDDFLRKKALWQAYEWLTPSVLLIDEIDKAPRDFPNDLLLELDKHRFRHPFEDRFIDYAALRPPIVVITSNAERRLPDAFLRRCIYHDIELSEELVKAALDSWNRNPDFPDTRAIQETALERFWELRKMDAIQKKPATAELLVWLAVLSARRVGAEDLRTKLNELPAREALIKDREDLKRLDEYLR